MLDLLTQELMPTGMNAAHACDTVFSQCASVALAAQSAVWLTPGEEATPCDGAKVDATAACCQLQSGGPAPGAAGAYGAPARSAAVLRRRARAPRDCCGGAAICRLSRARQCGGLHPSL